MTRLSPRHRRLALISLPVFAGITGLAWACSAYFPTNLLQLGAERAQGLPEGDYALGLQRIPAARTGVPARQGPLVEFNRWDSPQDARAEIAVADLCSLDAALRAAGTPATTTSDLLRTQAAFRLWVEAQREDGFTTPDGLPGSVPDCAAALLQVPPAAEGGPAPPLPTGLPEEFVRYNRGVLAWSQGDAAGAAREWTALLNELPPAKRHYRSTWAAFSAAAATRADPALARRWLYTVEVLAGEGYDDAAQLATASLGERGRLARLAGQPGEALRYYRAQWDAGDEDGARSLWLMGRVLASADPKDIPALARDEAVAAAVLAQWGAAPVESFGPPSPYDEPPEEAAVAGPPRWRVWLEELAKVDTASPQQAEALAWMAYRAGDYALAQRWVARPGVDTPRSHWLRAKLALRDGRIAEAEAALRKAAAAFPAAEAWRQSELDPLFGGQPEMHAKAQVEREIGVLVLARQDYADALTWLTPTAVGGDEGEGSEPRREAAQVIERVLTTAELEAWLQAHPQRLDAYLRDVAARRLLRDGRGTLAVALASAEVKPLMQRYLALRTTGADPRQPAAARAEALWGAAQLVRQEGLRLIATAEAPDFAFTEGNFEPVFEEGSPSGRASSGPYAASKDERQRMQAHAPQPRDVRWHYRATAAALAEQAAALLTANDPSTQAKAREMREAARRWVARLPPA